MNKWMMLSSSRKAFLMVHLVPYIQLHVSPWFWAQSYVCSWFLTPPWMCIWFIFVIFVCLTFTWVCSVCSSRPWVLKDRDHLSHIFRMEMLDASGQQAGHPESQEAVGREDSQPPSAQELYLGKSLNTSYCLFPGPEKGDRWLSANFF
jgi:hypothetical protein